MDGIASGKLAEKGLAEMPVAEQGQLTAFCYDVHPVAGDKRLTEIHQHQCISTAKPARHKGVKITPLAGRKSGRALTESIQLTRPNQHISVDGYNHLSFAIPGLRKALVGCPMFRLPERELGNRLQAHIKAHANNYSKKQKLRALRDIPEGGRVYGGRSFSVKASENKEICYKFCLKTEEWQDFIREEAVHQFFHEHAPELQLTSEVPQPGQLFKIKKSALPVSLLQQFSSELAEENGYVFGYSFSVSSDYNRYCTERHKTGTGLSSPEAAESGLLSSIGDIARCARFGGLFTSPVKMFHHYRGVRAQDPWTLLGSLLQERWDDRPSDQLPGYIGCWLKGIDRPDYGLSGLRDMGDIEFQGDDISYLYYWDEGRKVKLKGFLEDPNYKQNVCVLNTLGNALFSAMLCYAALHRADQDYTWRDESCVTRTGEFLTQCADLLLSRFFGEPLKFADCFDEFAHFEQWRDLAARELVYWTEKMGRGSKPDDRRFDLFRERSESFLAPGGEQDAGFEEIYLGYLSDGLIFLVENIAGMLKKTPESLV